MGRRSAPPVSGSEATSTRMFFLRVSASTAPGSYEGAIITSVKMVLTYSAISTLTAVFAAITPPKALIGSHSWALRCASATETDEMAIPHGLACLIIATHFSSWSNAARQAASASVKLL